MQEKLLSEITLQRKGNSPSKVMGIFQQIPIITYLSQNFNKLLDVAWQTNIKIFFSPLLFSLVIQQQLNNKHLSFPSLWFP